MGAEALRPEGRLYLRVSLLLVIFVFLTNIHRAWAQSITGDEAFTYNLFLSGSLSKLFNSYDASHHVFHTILCKIFISLFGLSEFTLRIPSLLGGLLYLITVFRVARHLFGHGWLLLISVTLLSLNPLLFDYMSVARGYGLALGFFLWALFQMMRCLETSDRSLVY